MNFSSVNTGSILARIPSASGPARQPTTTVYSISVPCVLNTLPSKLLCSSSTHALPPLFKCHPSRVNRYARSIAHVLLRLVSFMLKEED